ncbi:cell wall-binding repeat-containing protein [Ornithinimicrobium tianjinense]|uniref:NodB homology domain-containing protein n=1 Tax=Ornithinimicrobium tianjinense TaxID=1195761 RepID=A0A917BRP9_9MICO|nr:cell wall-binding repeat-containing protein [Ornithinimicrobium tianjinense]GGF53550.1 hypothetical protein GCM10011366_21650 [Ornithinimicrobium tianjinense]
MGFRRGWSVVVALAALLAAGGGASALPAQGQVPATDTSTASTVVGPPTSRLAGPDRYASAVEISQWRYRYPSAADVVYLTRGDTFADALAAGTLSDGPVLLTKPACGALPSVVRAEIERIDPDAVVALGGPAAVCDEVLADAANGRPTERIGGATRQETAALIAARAFPEGAGTAYLTTGAVGPDAVVGGMLRDGPILLTSSDGLTLPEVTRTAVAELGATTVTALGGSVAVPDAVLAEAADGRTTTRLAGANRWETAVAIAAHAYPDRTSRVYLARGDGSNFVDALASGMLVDGPVLLTSGPCDRVVGATDRFLERRHPDRVVALGGAAALCGSTLSGASIAARPAIDCAVTRCVALTFDDGPSWPTPTLLDTLASHRVPATFFQVGAQVDAYAQHSRRAWVEGHDVANHTWDHPQLPTLTYAQQLQQVTMTDNELNQHGIPDTRLLRPPYGLYDTDTRRLGFPLIIWDVDPRDWDGPPSTATVRARVVNNVRDGSIVLQHDVHINSVNAVPGIIADLTAMGYTFVTVRELVPDMQDGDIVLRRDDVRPFGTSEVPTVLDGSGVPGLAPDLSTDQLDDE